MGGNMLHVQAEEKEIHFYSIRMFTFLSGGAAQLSKMSVELCILNPRLMNFKPHRQYDSRYLAGLRSCLNVLVP
jgi:hypothetical protein